MSMAGFILRLVFKHSTCVWGEETVPCQTVLLTAGRFHPHLSVVLTLQSSPCSSTNPSGSSYHLTAGTFGSFPCTSPTLRQWWSASSLLWAVWDTQCSCRQVTLYHVNLLKPSTYRKVSLLTGEADSRLPGRNGWLQGDGSGLPFWDSRAGVQSDAWCVQGTCRVRTQLSWNSCQKLFAAC